MELRKCTKCEAEQPLDCFAWHVKAKQIRHHICKACVNRRSKSWYAANKKEHINTVQKATKRRMTKLRESIEQLGLICSTEKCDESHPAVLDFHHTDPSTKEANVSDMIAQGRSVQDILEEIKKCVVLCSNCHRKLHWNMR